MKILHKLRAAANAAFHIPSAQSLAIIELEQAKREHLQMLTAQDYSRKMVEYHADRIKRLTAYIAKASEKSEAV
jgi:hypothetical protein